jgi:alpha-L-fucosidase 2
MRGKMSVKLFPLRLLGAILFLSLFTEHTKAQQIWDNKPARIWMSQAYPIGNGRIGGMIFGGVTKEHIQFNDNTLWQGNETERGAYQAFGDLFIDFDIAEDSTVTPENYHRELDIGNAIHRITFTKDGVAYQREYFCSFPDKVMVLRFTAGKKGAFSGALKLSDAHGKLPSALGNSVSFNGKLANGLAYHATALLKLNGGSSVIAGDSLTGQFLKFRDADTVTILLTAATNFSNTRETGWRGMEAGEKVAQVLAHTRSMPYGSLMRRHLIDYRSLYKRVSIDLGKTRPGFLVMPTDQRVLNYKKNDDPGLEALIFQYGRYLLISSSRKGGLPANLQGLWNDSNTPPWGGDYHTNINLQMNYWLAEPANLSECHFPYLDHINAIREIRKINTQKEYPGVRGWTLRTESNPFGGESYLWNPPASAWYAQALWEHYAFTGDRKYLRDFAYPIIKEITEFWDDHLKRRPDGSLVSPNSWSPEHGPVEDGIMHDQMIVFDLFSNYIASAKILGLDSTYRHHVTELRDHLLKPKIGRWGQLQEWETDRDDPNDKHRHVSQLFGLYPGKQINYLETPELTQAAKVSLLARGDASTGWSMAWKINFWARLMDGGHAHDIIKNFITLVPGDASGESGGIYANLLCAHPPFQIDGNFGYTAGITELLLQSQAGFIQLLPALPKAWVSGNIKGLKARGDFEVCNLQWKKGSVSGLSVKSLSGGICKILSPDPIRPGFNGATTTRLGSGYVYRFDTQKGHIYKFFTAN